MMSKKLNNQLGITPPLVLVAVVGIIAFLLIANAFSFKDKFFNALYPKPPSHAAGAVELNLLPTPITVTTGDNFNVDIAVNPNGEQVSAAEINLSFDPQKLQPVSLQPTTAIPVVLVPASLGTDTASITLGIDPGSPVTSAGSIATIVFKALQTTSTPTIVSFNTTTTQVAALNKPDNVVGTMTNTSVTINGTSVTPTSTPIGAGDTTPPTVALTSPLNGAVLARNSRITLSATAADNTRVTKVEFWVAGRLVNADTTAPYSYSYKLPGKRQPLTIKAVAFDASNNTSSSSITIQVN